MADEKAGADPKAGRSTGAGSGTATTSPTITDHRIRDLGSFDSATTGARSVAGIYFYAALDGLVELAHAASLDFFKRPHLYVNSEDVAPLMAKLRARLGTDELLPSEAQRNEVYSALTGQTSAGPAAAEDGDFQLLQAQLIQAATAFAERVFDTGEQMLRERVRTAHRPFKEYLSGLEGDSLTWSREEALSNLTEGVCYPILRDDGVAAVFSLATAPRDEWPYDADANADKIVESIAMQLGVTVGGGAAMTRQRFSSLQTVARTGAEAIATVIDFESSGAPEDLDLLISKVYTWGSELNAFAS